MKKRWEIWMVGSSLEHVKGGMVTVAKSFLRYGDWEDFHLQYVPSHVEGGKLKKLFWFVRAYVRILAALAAGKCDLLHLHVSERGSVYRKAMFMELAHFFRKPVILHHHGAEFWQFYRGLSRRKKRYVRRMLEKADCNFVLSEQARRQFRRIAPAARYRIVHNFVRLPEKNPYEGGNAVITMGRLGERKGTFDLLRAFHELDPVLPAEIRLWLCGDGDLDEVKRAVSRLGLEKRVAWIGWISGEEKETMCRNAICHVLPSYREVLPMSILETMACGIPNIGTRIASIPEVITDGENGFLIRPGDINALKDRLWILCTEPKIGKELSGEAYGRISREFSEDVCCKKVKAIYRKLLTRKQKRGERRE